MLVEPNKVQYIFCRIFQIDVRHYYFAVVSWSCDTKLGTAAPVLCFLPVRTINTRLLLTQAYESFQWLQNHVYAVSYVSLSDGPLEVSVPRPYGALFSSLGCAYSTLIVYSARILEEFHLIRLRFITHLKIHFSGFHSYYLCIKHKVHPGRFTPPRQGGGTSLHDRLPCIWISPLSRI